jgi:hypothetical protein
MQGKNMQREPFRFVRSAAWSGAIVLVFALLSNANQFSVIDSCIYTPEGTEFVLRGVMVNGVGWFWNREPVQDAARICDSWKFNAVRPLTRLFPPPAPPNPNPDYQPGEVIDDDASYHEFNRDVVDAFTAKKCVVIVNSSDKRLWESGLDSLKEYWTHTAEAFRDNPYVWFNIMFETGSEFDLDQWYDVNRQILSIIRTEKGCTNVVMIGGSCNGAETDQFGASTVSEEKSYILTKGKDLVDEFGSIVFMVKVQDEWECNSGSQTLNKLTDYIDRVRAQGMAIVAGTWMTSSPETSGWYKEGPQSYPNAARAVIASCKQRNFGQIVWHWNSGDRSDLTKFTTKKSGRGAGWDINDTENPTNLTWLGNELWELNRYSFSLSELSVSAIVLETETGIDTRQRAARPLLCITAGSPLTRYNFNFATLNGRKSSVGSMSHGVILPLPGRSRGIRPVE